MNEHYVNRRPPRGRSVLTRTNPRRKAKAPTMYAKDLQKSRLGNPNIMHASAKSTTFYLMVTAILVIVALTLFFIISCVTGQKSDTFDISGDDAQIDYSQINVAYTLQDGTTKKDELIELIGEEKTSILLEATKTNKDALWVALHPDQLAKDGDAVQVKLLTLAAKEPDIYGFVRDFGEKYPIDNRIDDISIGISASSPSPDVPDTLFPHFYQWDRRWGNTVYSSTAFGFTGCGPTSLAMIYQGLTGNTDLDPYDMALKAQEYGYMEEYNGTAHGFFSNVANDLGISCLMVDPSAELITSSLKEGKAIIINFGTGYFSEGGHFAVLTGLDKDGKVIMNDPYSIVRSSQTWDADFLASEAPVMYLYSM